ncbi:MAG: PTS system mannose-specific EIIBCA component [bacterium ADurb.Bin478]|nr:MAG: PTS system mannose-specific EIIBCA component [bacterium ADurb.Bin478]
MRLLDYLAPNLVFLDLTGKDKNDVISKVVHLMKQQKAIDDEKNFLQEVFQREKLGCTAIGGNVAIPHARTRTVKNIVIAFARLTPGVDFCAMDQEPIRLLFLLGTPMEAVGDYLKVLAKLSKLLKDGANRDRLIQAGTAEEVYAILEELEQHAD